MQYIDRMNFVQLTIILTLHHFDENVFWPNALLNSLDFIKRSNEAIRQSPRINLFASKKSVAQS